MFSYQFYNVLHFFGIMLTFVSLGAMIYHAKLGQGKAHPLRRLAILSHGIGLFLVLLAGFGMLARLQIHWPWPGWVVGKLIIWLILGGLVAVFYRKPQPAAVWWGLVVILGTTAAWMAVFKPI